MNDLMNIIIIYELDLFTDGSICQISNHLKESFCLLKYTSSLFMLDPSYFRNGLKHYLEQHEYKNAQTSDLWQSLSEISQDPDIASLMDSWTLHKNYPYVTLSLEGTSVNMRQDRFVLSRNMEPQENHLWWIPMTLSAKNPNFGTKRLIFKVREIRKSISSTEKWANF